MDLAEQNTSRLDFRLSAPNKGLIDRAAACLGLTTTAFAVSTLTERARQVVDEHTTITLSDRARDSFLAKLDEDAEPNARLRQAADRHKRSVIA